MQKCFIRSALIPLVKPKYVASFAFSALLMIVSPVTSLLCLASLGVYYVMASRIGDLPKRPAVPQMVAAHS